MGRTWGGVLERIKNITFENSTFERMFKNYDEATTLFYCDPPYINTTDYKDRGVEYTEEDHKRLIECLLNIRGMAIMSNYENELNKPLLDAGWRLEKKDFRCTLSNNRLAEGRDSRRTECLYLSPRIIEKNNFLF